MPEGDRERARPQRLLYGRRTAHRLRPGRQRLLAELLPRLQIKVPDQGCIAPGMIFGDDRPLWLEIGFGAGEHLAAQARAHPEVGLIGCEPFISGVASLLAQIECQAIANVRVVIDDARVLMAALPARSLARIFVLFPDPWPKARHHKRRIVNPQTVAGFARLLQAGGEVRLASDDLAYARVMLEFLLHDGRFCWLAERPCDWRERPSDWPPTRYETKALSAGRKPVYLRFKRRPETAPDDQKGLKQGAQARI